MAVTERLPLHVLSLRHLLVLMMLTPACLLAATLPEENVDAFYHRYEGGGMTIDGPSVLVRKSAGNQLSLTGQYYVDSVSAASVDVLATASEYKEEREEYSLGVDYLHEDAILSVGYSNSSENDYEADNVFFSVSQEFFGGMSTVTMGYIAGQDEIGQIGSSGFSESSERRNYQLGLSQVLTRSLLVGADLEIITDQGYLQNPYRQNRYTDPEDPGQFLYQPERYPETRTSTSGAIRGLYYLPYRASLKGEYRYFSDSWGVRAHTFELAYVHPWKRGWTLEGRARYYTQDEADFYSDLFPYANSQTHLARDKELSSLSGITLGGGVVYEWPSADLPGVEGVQLSLLLDWLRFSYDNFRDVTAVGDYRPGEEPLYDFNALVTRASVIVKY